MGSCLLEKLLSSSRYSKVISLGRRKVSRESGKLEQIQSDLEKLIEIPQVDDVFCCLGTTIRKAGNQDNFKKVDLDAVVNLARLAQESGAKQFLVVSAVGADSNSKVFYNQVKGQMEDDIRKFGISVKIFRPSLLLGPRREFRFGELLFQWTQFLPIWWGPLLRYKPIPAEKVAGYILRIAEREDPTSLVIESDLMQSEA